MGQKLERIIAVTGASLILLMLTAIGARAGSGSRHLTREDLMRRSSAGVLRYRSYFSPPSSRTSRMIRKVCAFRSPSIRTSGTS